MTNKETNIKTQDPKYYIRNNRLYGQSGIIPEDEPIFILRGRDLAAVRTLNAYLDYAYDCGALQEHIDSVSNRIAVFRTFAREKEKRMRIPDTDSKLLHDTKL